MRLELGLPSEGAHRRKLNAIVLEVPMGKEHGASARNVRYRRSRRQLFLDFRGFARASIRKGKVPAFPTRSWHFSEESASRSSLSSPGSEARSHQTTLFRGPERTHLSEGDLRLGESSPFAHEWSRIGRQQVHSEGKGNRINCGTSYTAQYMTIIVRSFKLSATAQSVATDLPATDAEGLRNSDKHRKNA